jgi:hypothetical protein
MAASGQLQTKAAPFPRVRDPPVPIEQEAWWAPEPVWTQRLKENYFAYTGARIWISRSSSQ